jgi:transposase-like protein
LGSAPKIRKEEKEQDMKQNRRKHSPSFKARVALEALKGEDPSQIRAWKKALAENAAGIFGGDGERHKKSDQQLVAQLYQQIGQLKVERDFLENALGR